MCKSCRSWKMLRSAYLILHNITYLLAKFGFDTAKNEPAKNCKMLLIISNNMTMLTLNGNPNGCGTEILGIWGRGRGFWRRRSGSRGWGLGFWRQGRYGGGRGVALSFRTCSFMFIHCIFALSFPWEGGRVGCSYCSLCEGRIRPRSWRETRQHKWHLRLICFDVFCHAYICLNTVNKRKELTHLWHSLLRCSISSHIN